MPERERERERGVWGFGFRLNPALLQPLGSATA